MNQSLGVREIVLKAKNDPTINYKYGAMAIDAVARFGLILDPKLTACFNKENYI